MAAIGTRETYVKRAAVADPVEIYRRVRSVETLRSAADPFAAHVLGCALTISILEANDAADSVGAAIGLDRSALDAALTGWAPGALDLVDLSAQPESLRLDEEESQLLELLYRHRADDAALTGWIARIVTRRAMSPRHLWQDLGLVDRAELTRLVGRWFPKLAAANSGNMKWKKFFYRKICELEGFSLCAAPSCRECNDFDHCFGEESGESALARLSL